MKERDAVKVSSSVYLPSFSLSPYLKTEEVELLKKHIQKVTDEVQTILKEYSKLDKLVKKYSKVFKTTQRE